MPTFLLAVAAMPLAIAKGRVSEFGTYPTRTV
jgi:hypothetical protein